MSLTNNTTEGSDALSDVQSNTTDDWAMQSAAETQESWSDMPTVQGQVLVTSDLSAHSAASQLPTETK